MTRETVSEIAFRGAVASDVPRMVELIEGAKLPAWQIEEWLEGFVVGEWDGAVVACGGIEVYEDAAVIRSVVVDESLRGQGVGRALAGRLLEDAARAGVRDVYLFTVGAASFWERLGFRELTLSDWREPSRACWQYAYISAHPDEARGWGLVTMGKALEARS